MLWLILYVSDLVMTCSSGFPGWTDLLFLYRAGGARSLFLATVRSSSGRPGPPGAVESRLKARKGRASSVCYPISPHSPPPDHHFLRGTGVLLFRLLYFLGVALMYPGRSLSNFACGWSAQQDLVWALPPRRGPILSLEYFDQDPVAWF